MSREPPGGKRLHVHTAPWQKRHGERLLASKHLRLNVHTRVQHTHVGGCDPHRLAFRRVGTGVKMGGWLSRVEVDAFVPESPGQVKNTSHEADHSGLRTRVLLNGA